jgi:GT2 family glycosyltransferase
MEPLDITVIFSCHNGAGRLPRTLASLERQALPTDRWHIVAVDNNSSDDTFAILSSYADRLPIEPMQYPVPGKSGALNRAIERARGELIVFTDDDVDADPNWLSAIVACARANPDYGIFGGRILPDWEARPSGQRFLDWIPMGSTFAIVEDDRNGPCEATKVWGPNTTIRRSLLTPDLRYREDIGPLPGGVFAMGEDQEIVMRLAGRGARAYRCADAVVHHWIPASSVSERWVQQRGERLGYGVPALFPERVPRGPRIAGVPVATWLESAMWNLRALALYPLPSSRLRFWAIWKYYYLRGYRAGIRRYMA